MSLAIRSDHTETDACQEEGFLNVGWFGETLKHLLDYKPCCLWFHRAAPASHAGFMCTGFLLVVQRYDLIWNPYGLSAERNNYMYVPC